MNKTPDKNLVYEKFQKVLFIENLNLNIFIKDMKEIGLNSYQCKKLWYDFHLNEFNFHKMFE